MFHLNPFLYITLAFMHVFTPRHERFAHFLEHSSFILIFNGIFTHIFLSAPVKVCIVIQICSTMISGLGNMYHVS